MYNIQDVIYAVGTHNWDLAQVNADYAGTYAKNKFIREMDSTGNEVWLARRVNQVIEMAGEIGRGYFVIIGGVHIPIENDVQILAGFVRFKNQTYPIQNAYA